MGYEYGAPFGISYVFDNGGVTADRYTVFFGPIDAPNNRLLRRCLSLSDNPEHPQQGFSQWGEGFAGLQLGNLISYNDLPANVRTHIAGRLT